MGWNSWYVWENHVTDKIMRDAADAMVSSGMIDHGYMYVNIDDCWSAKPGSADSTLNVAPRDEKGMINSNKRFPDMKALTGYIHSKGLKAGIYTSPGPLTCAGHTAAYGHEEQDVARFVDWGYDFLKYDWCSYDNIGNRDSLADLQKPYILISKILKNQKEILSLIFVSMGWAMYGNGARKSEAKAGGPPEIWADHLKGLGKLSSGMDLTCTAETVSIFTPDPAAGTILIICCWVI